eukprot:5138564-Ditylum_brightwellii.AAC.1
MESTGKQTHILSSKHNHVASTTFFWLQLLVQNKQHVAPSSVKKEGGKISEEKAKCFESND